MKSITSTNPVTFNHRSFIERMGATLPKPAICKMPSRLEEFSLMAALWRKSPRYEQDFRAVLDQLKMSRLLGVSAALFLCGVALCDLLPKFELTWTGETYEIYPGRDALLAAGYPESALPLFRIQKREALLELWKLRRCLNNPNNRYVFVQLSLFWPTTKGLGFHGHASGILIDQLTKKMLVLEPQSGPGYLAEILQSYTDALRQKFSWLTEAPYFLSWDIDRSHLLETCPYYLQGRAGKDPGRCVMWAVFLLSLVTCNPDCPYRDLLDFTNTFSVEEMENFLASYALVIVRLQREEKEREEAEEGAEEAELLAKLEELDTQLNEG